MKRTNFQPTAQYVSTAQVATALGVSVTTVKRWVDDEILPAQRTAGGHRKLLLADVIRLVREGGLPGANLAHLDGALAQRRHDDAALLTQRLLEALRLGQMDTVRGVIHGAYHGGATVEWIADQVIAPALAVIGHEWEHGALDVMHEHRATQMTAAAVFELKATIDRHARSNRPKAVGGAIEGDHYLLPSLLAHLALLDAGWDVINLGPNTPFASMERAIDELRPRLMWISISFLADAAKFESDYNHFFTKASNAGVAVAIGGRALTEDLRARIPYTTFGDGLMHLVSFARTLNPCPRRPKRGRPVGTSASS